MNYRILCVFCALAISGNASCELVSSLDPVISPTTLGTSINTSADWCGCDLLAAGGAGAGSGIIQLYRFDQTTNTLSRIGTTTTLGDYVQSLDWCSSCLFLAAVGQDASIGIIQLYGFDQTTDMLSQIGTTTTLGSIATEVAWCPSCRFLAVGGNASALDGIIQVYSFDPENPSDLVRVGDSLIFVNNHINSLKWCGNCHYLAAGGDDGILYVYRFDPDAPADLVLTASIDTSENIIFSVDWCDCGHIAVGGQDGVPSLSGIIKIYTFDSLSSPILEFVTSATISSEVSAVNSVQWCQECDNIAVGGVLSADPSGILQLYHFDQLTTLSLQQSQSLDSRVSSVDWCDDCNYLVVGGRTSDSQGSVQIFKATKQAEINAPANLRATQNIHRFPTQIDIINTICWDPVVSAVLYNVYSDANLTNLLATITAAPLCFTQHQICRGKKSTYYVTAIDAEGNISEPASVTV